MFATPFTNNKQETNQFPIVSAPIPYVPVALPSYVMPTMVPLPVQAVNINTAVCIYDITTNSLQQCQIPLPHTNGMILPLEGWSFVTMPGFDSEASSRESSVAPTSFSRPVSVENTPEPVIPAEPAVAEQRMEETIQPEHEPVLGQRRKFPHGSKQVRIMEVFNNIKNKYSTLGTWASDNELLRGTDTVRVHVKNYKGLNKIEEALEEIDSCPHVRIHKIATPFSMKNKYQKKGFIVYLRLQQTSMVPYVQGIFSRYAEFFKKCDVALPKENSTFVPGESSAFHPYATAAEPTLGDFLDKAKTRERSDSEEFGLCGEVSVDDLDDVKPIMGLTPRSMVARCSWGSQGC